MNSSKPDDYYPLVDTRKNRSFADPFVIAVASLNNPPLIVVTQEGATNKIDKPRIPDVRVKEGLVLSQSLS